MAKQPNQKLKILYILQFLQRKSDEEHPVTMNDIIDELGKYDISAERKSIYNDIEALRRFGYDIELIHSRTAGGYYLASREFELAELKILVDSIQASKFITTKKTRDLIKKLSSLCSEYEARQLKHEVHVIDRIKTKNENIFYNVDALNSALNQNRVIQFKYYEYNEKGELVLKNKNYQVSPLGLIFQNENYYLVAFDFASNEKRHYRVDKMMNISICDQRCLEEHKKNFDIVTYSNENFGMYAGDVKTVRLHVNKKMIGVVIDRFGSDLTIRPVNDSQYEIRVTVAISGQFFGWLVGIGKGITIANDPELQKRFKDYLNDIIKHNQ